MLRDSLFLQVLFLWGDGVTVCQHEVCSHEPVHVDARIQQLVCFDRFPFYHLRQGLSLKLEPPVGLHWLASMTPESTCLSPRHLQNRGCRCMLPRPATPMDPRDVKAGPRTAPSGLSSRPCFALFFSGRLGSLAKNDLEPTNLPLPPEG